MLISTPPTAHQLRQPFRGLVKLVGFLRLPRWLGRPLVRLFWPLFIKGSDQDLLKADHRPQVIAGWQQSVRDSTWVIHTIRALADGRDLGPAIDHHGRVVMMHLGHGDEVVNVSAAITATQASYPYAQVCWISGTHHGVPEVDGEHYGWVLKSNILPHFEKLFFARAQ